MAKRQKYVAAGVYVLGSGRHQWFKIGESRYIENRARDVMQGLPFASKTVRKYLIEPRKELEAYLHKSLQRFRVRGEWFYCEQVQFLELCDKHVEEFKNRSPEKIVIAEPPTVRLRRETYYTKLKSKMAPYMNVESRLPIEDRIASIEKRLASAIEANELGAVGYLGQQLEMLRKLANGPKIAS